MSGRVLNDEEINQFETLIDSAYGNAIDTLYMVGNVPMGSPDVILSIQKKNVQSLITTIRDLQTQRDMYKQQMEYWRAASDQFAGKITVMRDVLKQIERYVPRYEDDIDVRCSMQMIAREALAKLDGDATR